METAGLFKVLIIIYQQASPFRDKGKLLGYYQSNKGFRNTPDKRRGIMGKLGNNPVTSAFSQEFDGKPEYTVEELSNMFSIAESMATAMGVALLMPRTSIVRYVRNRGYKKRIPLYGDSVLCTCDRNVVRDAANQFQVSYKSMFYRLRDLKLFEPRELDEFLLKCGDAGGVI